MTDTLTTEAVAAALRTRLHPDAVCRELRRGAVGNGQETWFVTVGLPDGDHQMVLRRTAVGGPLEWTDRRAEAEVMNLAADHGLPVPRVRWVADDDSELGRPYLVMDRASGVAGGSRGDRQARAEDLARWLARLHAADIPLPGGRVDASETVTDQLTQWRATFRARRPAPWPLVDALLACLAQQLPPAVAGTPAVMLWGDAGLHNALADGDGITALLDWELAHPGHPLEDLGATLWMEADGDVDTDAVVRAYEREAGTAVEADVLDAFVAMACVTRSIMILGAGAAFVEGRTHAPSLAGLALDLPVHELGRAARLLGWDDVADPSPPAATPSPGPRPGAAEVDRGVARHLAEDVLPGIEDRHTRRGLRTAVALLEASARRAELDPWVHERTASRAGTLRGALAAAGLDHLDVGEAVATAETDPALAGTRPALRRLLLEDLADRRAVLAPLAQLYRPSTSP